MKTAVVDIGSNTIKMKIFKYSDSTLKEIYSEVKNTKLISYINNGVLSVDGILLLCQTIDQLKEHSKQQNADLFTCFATASLRRTSNIHDITKAVFEVCGVKIDLISGIDEAFYSFSGVKNTMNAFPEQCVLLDMGGGSTEIVLCEKGENTASDSMNFGSLSLYLDNPENIFDKMKSSAVSALKACSVYPLNTKNAVLVGGTALAINTLYSHFFEDAEPYVMSFEKLKYMYKILKKYDGKTVSLLKEKVPHRITTVIPGLAAYIGIFEECGVENITVSTCGIREGYVFEKILKNTELK